MSFAEHRMCARHIYANWAKIYKGEKLQKQFWMIAKNTNMADFRIHKQQLLDLTKDGYEALFQTEPKHWCKAFFSEEFKSDIIDNNLSEAFNGRILEARCKPIISMLEDIRVIVMTRLQKQRDEAAKWTGQCGPRIAKRLDDNLASSRFCHPIWNGDDGYEVMEKTDKYVVQLDKLKCSCRAWQLSGIPCTHAICAIQAKYQNPKDCLHGYYHKSTYLAAYQHMIQVEGLKLDQVHKDKNHQGARKARSGGLADRHADCLVKDPPKAKFKNQLKSQPEAQLRRKPTEQAAQVPQSEAPYQTRGVLGRRLRQYGYGIYTDFNTGMTILHYSTGVVGCLCNMVLAPAADFVLFESAYSACTSTPARAGASILNRF
ncbi:uncharacterized protein LOC130135068 [Syzygium oleosum]|uniref:uncharacterized protein LOC130135068 n=1 Tax=Syzygium oleosum TaxID=219896 RepID=UPI0024BB45A5|nr:uncharacterized protein LOC130135068 [Syzygium oleosum]